MALTHGATQKTRGLLSALFAYNPATASLGEALATEDQP